MQAIGLKKALLSGCYFERRMREEGRGLVRLLVVRGSVNVQRLKEAIYHDELEKGTRFLMTRLIS